MIGDFDAPACCGTGFICDLVFTDSNWTLRNKTKQTVSYAFSLLSFARLAAFASGFGQHFGVLSSSLSLF